MKIVIMCGGRGKRLKHLTDRVPKPLSIINNKVILGLKLNQYIAQGFKDFIFCIGYKGEAIKDYISKEYSHINAEFSDSGDSAGILKRLFDSADLFTNSVIMTYGDTISKINLTNFIKIHDNGSNDATIALAAIKNPFGIVDFDQNNKITSFKEKPTFHYYIGYAVIEKSILLNTSKEIINSFDGEGVINLFQKLLKVNKLGAYIYSGHQLTFNTLEEFDKAKKQIKSFYTIYERKKNEE